MAVQKVTVYVIESYGIVSFRNALNDQKNRQGIVYILVGLVTNFLLAKTLDLFHLRPHSLLYNSRVVQCVCFPNDLVSAFNITVAL